MATFPQEIIDLIIDDLAGKAADQMYRETLYSCALCCRSFRSRVIAHTYGRVQMKQKSSSDDTRTRLQTFWKILQNDPSIGSVVHELEICGTYEPFLASFWKDQVNAVPLVFRYLNSVQRLILKENGKTMIPWLWIENHAMSSLSTIIESPSLQSLVLEHLDDFPMSFIRRCTRLKDLSLVQVNCRRLQEDLLTSDLEHDTQVSLESVNIRSSPTAIASLLSMSSVLTRLRSLRMQINLPDDAHATRNFILQVAPTLEELSLDLRQALFQRRLDMAPFDIDIGTMPLLRRLTLQGNVDYLFCTFPTVLCRLLRLRENPSNLESLNLGIQFDGVPLGQESHAMMPHEHWTSLDDSLVDDKYMALRNVNIVLNFDLVFMFPVNITQVNERTRVLADSLFRKVKESSLITSDLSVYATHQVRNFW